MQSVDNFDLNMAYQVVPMMFHPYTVLPCPNGYRPDQQQFYGGYGGPHIPSYYHQPSSPQHQVMMSPNPIYPSQSPVYSQFAYPDAYSLPQPLSHGYDPRSQYYGYQGDQTFLCNGQQNEPIGAYYGNCLVSSSQRDGDAENGRRAPESSEEFRVDKKHAEGNRASATNEEDLSVKLQKFFKVKSGKSKTEASSTNGRDSAERAKTPDEEPDNNRKTPEKEAAVSPKRFCCKFCKSNGETYQIFGTHDLKNEVGQVTCPILMKFVCPICKKTGAEAHTEKYCTERGAAGNTASHRYRRVRNSVGRLCVLKY